jgi:RNA polymerase sigma-70 factor (ECF subfamily)
MVTEAQPADDELLARARAGDADAFATLVAPYQRELRVHCYRMLGSLQDAEDSLQEILLAAWRGLDGFEGRASARTWLYRIATNRCLDARRAAGRRGATLPADVTIRGIRPPDPTAMTEIPWLQPFPDALLAERPDPSPGPEAVIEEREAVTLAFVAALQILPPLQRAVLILRDVLGYRARDVATTLDTTEESVTSALKRARATLDTGLEPRRRQAAAPTPGSPEERRAVARYVDAFSAHDVDAIVALLTEDVWLKMPPIPFEYHGRAAAAEFLTALWPAVLAAGAMRVLHTRANGQPAFASYRADPATGVSGCVGVFVLTLAGDLVSEVIHFDPALAARFGLPAVLPE